MVKKTTIITICLVSFILFSGFSFFTKKIEVNPGDDLAAKCKKAWKGTEIIINDGVYILSRTIYVESAGVSIHAKNSGKVRIVASKKIKSGSPMIHIREAGVSIKGIIFDGQFVENIRGLRGSIDDDHPEEGANDLLIENCEFTRLTKHAVDIDGARTIVRNTVIHKILRQNKEGERIDAHGIVTKHGKDIVIDRVDIRQCSGDAIQVDRGRWNNFRVINSHLWDSPLEEDMGGYKKGIYVSENAIDTKHVSKSRGTIALVNCRIHGFRTKLINNTAALNLKEGVEAVVDSCEVYDSDIGVRLRGFSKGMQMNPIIINTIIRDNNTGLRLEDKLRNFRMAFCTMVGNKKDINWAPDRKIWSKSYFKWDHSGWLNMNNLWIGSLKLPEISQSEKLGAANNMIIDRTEVDKNLKPVESCPAIQTPGFVDTWYEPTGMVVKDKSGSLRKKPSTIGAFER